MPAIDFGTKTCLNCGKQIKLKVLRDKLRKKFCSRSCSTQFYQRLGICGMNGHTHSDETRRQMSNKASSRVGKLNSNFKHGEVGSALYSHWCSMKTRSIRDYAGKNRFVCDEWKEYINFRDWAINNGFDKSLSLDRIDNSKGYYPENCQWIPMELNRIKDRKIKFTESCQGKSILV